MGLHGDHDHHHGQDHQHRNRVRPPPVGAHEPSDRALLLAVLVAVGALASGVFRRIPTSAQRLVRGGPTRRRLVDVGPLVREPGVRLGLAASGALGSLGAATSLFGVVAATCSGIGAGAPTTRRITLLRACVSRRITRCAPRARGPRTSSTSHP